MKHYYDKFWLHWAEADFALGSLGLSTKLNETFEGYNSENMQIAGLS